MAGNNHSRSAVYSLCSNHLMKELANTPLLRDPFPHVVIKQFFPKEIYKLLLESLPSAEHFHPFAYEKHAGDDGSSTRDRFQFTDDSIKKLDHAQREFIFGIRDVLGCKELKNAIFRKLSPGLAIRFSLPEEKAAQVPAYPLPELFKERSGYVIKPHPDTRKKIVTMQIALPQDEKQVELGTEFYTRSLNPLSLLREPRGFDINKTMQFLPNTAYAFSVLNNWRIKSWHGRTKLPFNPAERNSILNIWYANPQQGNQDIIRDHYQESPQLARCA